MFKAYLFTHTIPDNPLPAYCLKFTVMSFVNITKNLVLCYRLVISSYIQNSTEQAVIDVTKTTGNSNLRGKNIFTN